MFNIVGVFGLQYNITFPFKVLAFGTSVLFYFLVWVEYG